MILQLISLPDICKKNLGWFTIGNNYSILGEIGNGYRVVADNGTPAIVLKERFA